MVSKVAVHKFKVPAFGSPFTLSLPTDHEILSIHEQNGDAVIYAKVSVDNNRLVRNFNFVALLTGQTVFDVELGKYLGTAMLDKGAFVAHLFEVKNDEETRT